MRTPNWRDLAEAAWDEYKRDLMDRGEVHTIRQLRKREFIAGYGIAFAEAVAAHQRIQEVLGGSEA